MSEGLGGAAGPRPRLVHDVVDRAYQRHPHRPAVRDREGTWSYADLVRHSHGCGAWLKARGVTRGARVLVQARADRRVLAVLFACSRLGVIFVPVAATAKPAQWEHLITDAEPALVIADDNGDVPGPVVTLDDCCVEPADPGAAPCSTNGEGPDERDTALLIYTSGSTAAPKGVVCPHAQVTFVAGAIADQLRYRPDDVVFCRLPLSFDYGLYQAFLAALAGAELILADPDADARLLADIRRYGATVVPVVPTLATILLRLAGRDHRPTRVRLFTNTGEDLPPATIAGLRGRFPAAGVQLMFGMTEAKRVMIMEVDGDRTRPGAVGRPLAGTTVRIVDAAGAEVPPGGAGEIVVSGPHVTAGYWRDPELTARVFRPDPVTGAPALFTGDYGHLDATGYLYFHGRRDQIFKRHGTRTSTTEIEAAAYDIPGVREAAVVPPTGQRDAVLCVAADISVGEVLAQLYDRLDATRAPALCHLVDQLPRGSSGKLDRAALAALVTQMFGE